MLEGEHFSFWMSEVNEWPIDPMPFATAALQTSQACVHEDIYTCPVIEAWDMLQFPIFALGFSYQSQVAFSEFVIQVPNSNTGNGF